MPAAGLWTRNGLGACCRTAALRGCCLLASTKGALAPCHSSSPIQARHGLTLCLSHHPHRPHPQGYGNQKFVFQGVHETICYGPGEKAWAEDEPRINQIVFIGRGLDRKSLMMGFK